MITWFAMSAALMAATPTATSSVAGEVAPGMTPATSPAVAASSTATTSVASEAAPVTAPPAAPAVAGTSAPASTPSPGSAPAAGADAQAPKESKFSDHFAGSQMWFQTSATLGTLIKNLQQDYNPTVQTFLSLSPRYAITKDWQVRGRVGVSYEWTDSDTTTSRYVAQLTDTSLQLFYNGIPSFYGVKLQVAPVLVLPTSDASNARTMRLSTGVLTQVSSGWEVLGGSVMGIGQLGYQRPFYGYTTPGTDEDTPYAFQCAGLSGLDSTCVNQLSPWSNARDIVSWTLVLVGSWGDFAPGLAFQMSHQTLYHFTRSDRESDRLEDPNDVRLSTSFSVWLDYTPLPWFTAEVGYSLSRQLFTEKGTFGNPIADRYQDGQLYLGMNFGLETLYKTLTGQADEEGGVVRN